MQAKARRGVLIRSIEIRVLSHFALDFLPFFFVVQKNHSVAKMFAFDFALRPAQLFRVVVQFVSAIFAELFDLFSFSRSEA